MLLSDLVKRSASLFPEKVALVFGESSSTFAAFQMRVNRLTNALSGLDVCKGDRVAILLRNRPEYLELYFGITQGGGVAVPLNYRLVGRELSYIVNNSGANTLVAQSDYVDVVNSVRDELRGVKNFICVGGFREGYLNYEELLNNSSPEEPAATIQENDLAVLGYTSGTTGRPKGAMLTHKNIIAQIHNHLIDLPRFPEEKGLTFFPMFHIAFVTALTYVARGMTSVYADFDPKTACEIIEREKINDLCIPPAQINMLVNYPGVEQYDFSSLRTVTCGGGHTPFAVLKKMFALLPEEFRMFFISFAQTEASPMITCHRITRSMLPGIEDKINAFKDFKPSGVSVGRAINGVQVRIVDENDVDVAPGKVGEIICRGDNVMQGYWRLPESSAEALQGGWLHTGDMGFFDSEGNIYVVDRKKDMILSGDENIYPAEVEEVLYGHPAILEVAVIGVPDEKWGEAVKAVVVLKKGVTASEEEIREFCRGKIAGYKIPKSVSFVDILPRNPSGKVLKTELRKMFS